MNECLRPLFFSLIEITYEVESINSIYNGLNYGLSYLTARMNRSHT